MSPRNQSAGLSHPVAHGGYANTYQPSKYGIGSESSINATTGSNFRTIPADDSTLNTENGYMDRTYGFRGREFDLEPYRSPSHRGTDYSSDSGRGQTSRRMTDYSSDSGMSFKKHSGKSSDFELEIPSPDTSRSQSRSQNDDMIFSSPVKSSMQISDYYRLNDNLTSEDDGHTGRTGHLGDFRNLSRSEPNLDDYNDKFIRNGRNSEPEPEASPRNDDSHDNIQENGIRDNEDEDVRVNFTSPSLYHGDIENLTIVHRNNVQVAKNKASDLTDWQQKQRNAPTMDNNRLTLKPPSPRLAYDKPVSTVQVCFYLWL